mmetsp:Transcript_27007/g.75477  ORF Transcript_27007/g.75477 Transcript_27007/m.75477 type:complete len:108 (-) Transcript_27007:160-483(-)
MTRPIHRNRKKVLDSGKIKMDLNVLYNRHGANETARRKMSSSSDAHLVTEDPPYGVRLDQAYWPVRPSSAAYKYPPLHGRSSSTCRGECACGSALRSMFPSQGEMLL